MDMLEQRALNHAAYDRLKRGLALTYGRGRFVAISGGEVVAEADNFEELRSALTEMGKDPGESLIVQAGIEYPEKAVIFLADRLHFGLCQRRSRHCCQVRPRRF